MAKPRIVRIYNEFITGYNYKNTGGSFKLRTEAFARVGQKIGQIMKTVDLNNPIEVMERKDGLLNADIFKRFNTQYDFAEVTLLRTDITATRGINGISVTIDGWKHPLGMAFIDSFLADTMRVLAPTKDADAFVEHHLHSDDYCYCIAVAADMYAPTAPHVSFDLRHDDKSEIMGHLSQKCQTALIDALVPAFISEYETLDNLLCANLRTNQLNPLDIPEYSVTAHGASNKTFRLSIYY